MLATFDGGQRWQLVLSYDSGGVYHSGVASFEDLGSRTVSDGSVIYQPAVYGAGARRILLCTSDAGHRRLYVPYPTISAPPCDQVLGRWQLSHCGRHKPNDYGETASSAIRVRQGGAYSSCWSHEVFDSARADRGHR